MWHSLVTPSCKRMFAASGARHPHGAWLMRRANDNHSGASLNMRTMKISALVIGLGALAWSAPAMTDDTEGEDSRTRVTSGRTGRQRSVGSGGQPEPLQQQPRVPRDGAPAHRPGDEHPVAGSYWPVTRTASTRSGRARAPCLRRQSTERRSARPASRTPSRSSTASTRIDAHRVHADQRVQQLAGRVVRQARRRDQRPLHPDVVGQSATRGRPPRFLPPEPKKASPTTVSSSRSRTSRPC